MRMINLAFLLLSITFFTANPLFAQSPERSSDSARIALLLADHTANRNFSGAVLVAEAGQPIFRYATGKAGGDGPALQEESTFFIASITKMLVAVRILQLADKGLLSLEQTVEQWLPEYAIPKAKKISIHHLLLHISGLPSEPRAAAMRPLSVPELIRETLAEKKRSRKFGAFNYNNGDYVLLGEIISRVTGKSWQEDLRDAILLPLGMQRTGFLAHDELPDNYAKAYLVGPEGEIVPEPSFYPENFHAAAAMYSTTEDLLRFDQALYDTTFLSPQAYEQLAISYPEYGYVGYGVWNYNYPFLPQQPRVMERRGGVYGSNAALLRLPDSRHTIIILSNNDAFNPDSFGDETNLREAILRIVGGGD